MNAVIYARYSSHNQSEMSIEGQLHDAYEYAARNNLTVIGEYIDRALTGKTDTRPDFQRMIKDAEKKQFQVIIVWKLDRFARNRFDSAFYKTKLKKLGVRVVSVMENIPDSPEGIILEGMLESMAEYYSANLSENIRRGQQTAAAKGQFLGGRVPYGYIVQDHKLIADERAMPVVREIFRRYADGEKLTVIVNDLNARGYRQNTGNPFRVASVDKLLQNRTYIGTYVYSGTDVENMAERIIDDDTFALCEKRRNAHRRAPAANRGPVEFQLQGKLFCGHCGLSMCGDSGTSKTGDTHYYYSCSGRKNRKNGCKKKSEKKDFIEWYVCEQTVQYILDPDRAEEIASAVVKIYNADCDTSQMDAISRSLEAINAEVDKLVVRLGKVPDSAVEAIVSRMETLEAQRLEAEENLSRMKIQQKIPITEKEVLAWLSTFRHGDLMDLSFRQKIIDTFINSIYLYDDKIVIFFNIKGGQETAVFDPIDEADELDESSSLADLTPPNATLAGNQREWHLSLVHKAFQHSHI